MTRMHTSTAKLLTAVGLLAMLLCVVAPANAQSGASDNLPLGLTIEPYVVITDPSGGNSLDDIIMNTIHPEWFADPSAHPKTQGSANLDFVCNIPVSVSCPDSLTLTNFTNSDHVQVDVSASIGGLGDANQYGTDLNDHTWTMHFPPGIHVGQAFIIVELHDVWNPAVHKEGTYHGVLNVVVAPELD